MVERALERLRRVPRLQALAAVLLILYRIVNDLSNLQFIGQFWDTAATFAARALDFVLPFVRDFGWGVGVLWLTWLLVRPERKKDQKVARAGSVMTGSRLSGHPLRTAKQATEHRHFSDVDLTPHRLLAQAKGMTTAQLKTFAASQLGTWLRADGKIVDVWERPECVEVSLTAPGFTYSPDMGRVIAHFDSEWHERAIRLSKGGSVSVVGRIASVQSDVEVIDLEHAEIVDESPVKYEPDAASAKSPEAPKQLFTGPPIYVPTTAPTSPSERHFVNAAVTPHYLINALAGKTTAQVTTAVATYVGGWMRVEAPSAMSPTTTWA